MFWEVIVSVILSKDMYLYMCPIPNGFRDRAISLYREQQAMSSHELQSALILKEEFSKIHYTM
jgi:hypothetical protein